DGRALGVVEESRCPSVPVGAYVRHQLGWRERAHCCSPRPAAARPRMARAAADGLRGLPGGSGRTGPGGVRPGHPRHG
ncbi:hypothetical protein ABZ931_34375, partial [Streptomyces neyagawaensis]